MGTAVDSLWKRPGKASPSPVGDAKLGQLPHGGWQQHWGARHGPSVRNPASRIGSSLCPGSPCPARLT